jgi:two-component system, OmpR family, alkaline phosphatase synthesis response regulator PhoP
MAEPNTSQTNIADKIANMTRILLVDDETDILDFLSYNLKKEGYDVTTAENGMIALQKMAVYRPHLVILDIMMPELDGVEVCRQIRAKSEYNEVLIVFLTARDEDLSLVSALQVGGDEYISKPIKPQVLISRIKALMRRSKIVNDDDASVTVGDMVIDRRTMKILRVGQSIELPKKEFELLYLLASQPGKVFKREEIYQKIWGSEVIVGDRTIDVHIRKLREKLGSDNIRTLKGIGYKFDF